MGHQKNTNMMVTSSDRFYLPKFTHWLEQLKILNPLEYDECIDKVFFNESKDVLWMEFKCPKLSMCITEPESKLICGSFGFYFAMPDTRVKIDHCCLQASHYTYASESDCEKLRFLANLGMLNFHEDLCWTNHVEIKFTLTERIFNNGSI